MFRIEGAEHNEEVILRIKNISKMTKSGVRKAFYNIGKDLRKDTRTEIKKKNKTGKLYRINREGRIILHRASAPGQYPANLSGGLAQSISYKTVGDNRLEFGSRNIISKKGKAKQINYGKWLEEGTKKMKARPFLLPTIKSNYNKIETHFNYQIRKELLHGNWYFDANSGGSNAMRWG